MPEDVASACLGLAVPGHWLSLLRLPASAVLSAVGVLDSLPCDSPRVPLALAGWLLVACVQALGCQLCSVPVLPLGTSLSPHVYYREGVWQWLPARCCTSQLFLTSCSEPGGTCLFLHHELGAACYRGLGSQDSSPAAAGYPSPLAVNSALPTVCLQFSACGEDPSCSAARVS